MKKILLLIAILAANVFVYATIFEEPEGSKEHKLCRGYKSKSYAHLSLNLNVEFVKCCALSQQMDWCDFLAESPLCEEHLKYRIKDVCVTFVIEDEPQDELCEDSGEKHY